MRYLPRSLPLVPGVLWGMCLCASPSRAQATAIVHATVIPMEVERVLRDQTVVVAEGKIVAMGPSSEVKVPQGALRVDARGRYLLPALCDMHVHLLSEAWNMMSGPKGL